MQNLLIVNYNSVVSVVCKIKKSIEIIKFIELKTGKYKEQSDIKFQTNVDAFNTLIGHVCS